MEVKNFHTFYQAKEAYEEKFKSGDIYNLNLYRETET